MVVRAKGQIRMNADLASGHVFDQIFDNLPAFESRMSISWGLSR